MSRSRGNDNLSGQNESARVHLVTGRNKQTPLYGQRHFSPGAKEYIFLDGLITTRNGRRGHDEICTDC